MIYLGWRLIQCLKTNENERSPCGDGRIKLAFLIVVILLTPISLNLWLLAICQGLLLRLVSGQLTRTLHAVLRGLARRRPINLAALQ